MLQSSLNITPPPNFSSKLTLRLLLLAVLPALIAGFLQAPRPAEAQVTFSGSVTQIWVPGPPASVSVAIRWNNSAGCGTQARTLECRYAVDVGGDETITKGETVTVPRLTPGRTYRVTVHVQVKPQGSLWQAPNPDIRWRTEITALTGPPATQSASGTVDPTVRSWPLTRIADDAPTEWWFPIGRGRCDMKDWDRPWTWKRWTPPTADKCGWISIPDVRADLEEPIDELAFKVYTALIPSPDIDGRARAGRPSGPSVKLAVWAVYPEQHYKRYNWTRRLKGPYESPITVCLPGSEGQVIHGYDAGEGKWVALESVEAEHEGHICGLHQHDLGLLVVSGN